MAKLTKKEQGIFVSIETFEGARKGEVEAVLVEGLTFYNGRSTDIFPSIKSAKEAQIVESIDSDKGSDKESDSKGDTSDSKSDTKKEVVLEPLSLGAAIVRVRELLELNPSYTKGKLSAFLMIDDYSPKVIKSAIDAIKPVGVSAVGWQGDYHNWLIESERTEIEAYDYLMGQSENVRNQLAQYLNLWAMSASIHSGVRVYRTMGNKK